MTENISTAKFVIQNETGENSLNLLVDGMHCPSCVAIIESALKKQPSITTARLNLSTKRLKVVWKGEQNQGDEWVRLINSMGYRAVPFDPETSENFEQQEEKSLLRTLAVAGFASGNLMLFSIPMWVSDGVEMGAITRNTFQWVQVLIAIPAIIYSGLPFYKSAWRALKEFRTNMDVPISVAVILSTIMSLFEIINHGKHAYLDSGVMLLFFLLIGRYLEARARGKARGAAHDLLQMMTGFATVLRDGGTSEIIPLSEIKEGMKLLIAAGEKIGADGEIINGISEIDTSLITGETMPQKVEIGAKLFAGTMNISAPITMLVTKAGERSLLAEIIRLMENAEQSQAKYVTIADKISGWYTPLVHILAAGTFLGWWLFMGAAWQVSLLYSATVLIITCPCALGLAVPVVQVLASGKLMRSGILLKSGSALERLAEITAVVFDKTGTLTLGKPELLSSPSPLEREGRGEGYYSQTGQLSATPHPNPPPQGGRESPNIQLAASLAAHSKHPLSQAIFRAYNGELLPLEVKEIAGSGLEAVYDGKIVRLGKQEFVMPAQASIQSSNTMELWLAIENTSPTRFTFADKLRVDSTEVVANLHKNHIKTILLSGDRAEVVAKTAQEVGIDEAIPALSPLEKVDYLQKLKSAGAKILMVGDGLNDAPSLASAYISMSPASAMDITQNAADIVFQGDKLQPVLTAWNIAKFSQILVKQNFALALLYNIIAIPMAIMGFVTPLIAAIAMSSSSLIVIANAMRLNLRK